MQSLRERERERGREGVVSLESMLGRENEFQQIRLYRFLLFADEARHFRPVCLYGFQLHY